jgi:arsenate reductase-like glutaredoxin family protein
MYKLLITITNPKAEGPISVSVFGHVVNFEYTARGRVRKLTGVIETPGSLSRTAIEKVKELLKEHGSSVEVTYKEDPVIAKAAKNIERMLSGIGTKMNKKSMRSMKSVGKSVTTAKTRKQVAKTMRSLAAMPEAEMSAAVAALPKSIQQRVVSQSARRGRTFSARSFRNGSMSKTMRRAREKKYAHMMKKRLALLASIAEGNERNSS